MESLREHIRSFLKVSSYYPAPEVCLVNQLEEDGFTQNLIRYSSLDGERIEAFLLRPTSEERRGAILALHQHNSQWAIGKSEIAGLVGDPHQAFGPALARRGMTVLIPDAVGFESRLKAAGWGTSLAPLLEKDHSTAEGWLQSYNQMAHRLVRGELLMRKILADCMTALSILQDQTKVSRLGVIGHSFGGIVTLFLAALDTRVAFACTSGALCSYRHKLATGTGLEMSLVIPSFAEHYDLDDMLRCVAPRKVFVVSSEDDPQAADADDLVRNAFPTFEIQECADHLQHLRVPGPHALDQTRFQAILDWTFTQATCS
jgi:cephalosporin-C deacetylase-like acetyl esterase